GTTSSSYSVNYTTANGTAAAGSDYNAKSGTLTFAAGGTSSQTFQVTTLTDSVVESPETVLVNLSGQTGGATITTGQGSGTINDVPPPPSFAISNATGVSEGSPLTFTVTKTGTTSSSFSVNYATADGTAAAGSDYTAKSGTLTFAAGGTSSQTFQVTTLTDGVIESPETVLVNLSGQTGGATITTSQGSGTINDATSSNLPPVANADTTSFNCSVYQTVNLVANDTDPENNVPLHLVSITGPGSAAVTSTTSVTIGENSTGTFTFSYVVADSLGATSTGQLTATVTGLASQCVVY
ncbi:Calx-beta domain-containing protein, partial [Sphingomonas pruni]|uniref:Calx-beta domain-containing protein n=1 Tax=Sphingomonas pruni TaxID=40683 RepID=UPI000B26C0E9